MKWLFWLTVVCPLLAVARQHRPVRVGFNFPGETNTNGNDLTRQSFNVTSGISSGVITGPIPVQNGIAPNIVTPVSGQTCICVPTGRCSGTSNSTNDGSGLIDVRIVSSVSASTGLTSVINPAIVSASSCQVGLERCCLAGGYQCGLQYPPVASARPASTGQANYGEFPWQAVLLGPGDVYVGSGALIDNLHIITAAHKVTDYTSFARTLKVRLGEWDAAAASEPIAAQEYNVVRFFVHPSFNSINLQNDIAVLRLSSTVNLGTTPTIASVCLPATSFTGNRCWVSGWGKNDFVNGAYQAIQKKVDIPVLSTTNCESALRSTRLGPNFQLDGSSFICAGGEAGKDACTGDGGSPLVCALGSRYFVVGLVAWGIGCGAGGVPGVYVNVASYISWITSAINSS